jgi:hypothetical protein
MCRALTDGADLTSFAGGPFDMRAVVAAIRPEAKDGFLLDEVPWEHFPKGDRVRVAVLLLPAGRSSVHAGTGVVDGMCANGMRAAAALVVPFLIRVGADPRHPCRADALAEVSSPARARYFGIASRDGLLPHRADTEHDLYDDYGVEVTGYPTGWSVTAARAAITTDTTLLQPLLDDPDPAIRTRAAYTLATVTVTDPAVRAAFRTRLAAEQDPIVRAALVLATAEATHTRPHPPTTAWMRERWQNGHKCPRSGWPPRSAGSASPTNPPLPTCAPLSTTSRPTSAPRHERPALDGRCRRIRRDRTAALRPRDAPPRTARSSGVRRPVGPAPLTE